MALFTRYILSMTFKDGVNRDSVVSYYVLPTEAKLWFAAADHTAKLATGLGSLVTAVVAETAMSLINTQVTVEELNDPVVLPADTILRGNKLTFALRAGGRGLTTTIPGRDPAGFTQDAGSLIIDLSTPAAMVAFQTALESHVVDAFGNAVTLMEGRVVD